MKTRDLIRRLQDADPTGEAEVCVDNEDICWVHPMEAYWDGRLQVLERDGNRVVGAKVTSMGTKVKIVHLSIEEAIYDNPELPVDLSELGISRSVEEWTADIAKWREESRKMKAETEAWKAERAAKETS